MGGDHLWKGVCMEDRIVIRTYERPRIVDYGSLQDLTAACAEGGGGDAYTKGGPSFGISNPAYKCKSA
jgi:hypothetical protein